MAKIKAAISAREDEDFLIIARTDARAMYGIDEVVKRAKAYAKAGADMMLTAEALPINELALLVKSVDAQVMVAVPPPFHSYPSAEQLGEMGCKVIMYPIQVLSITYKAIADFLKELKTLGTDVKSFEKMAEFESINIFAGFPKVRELEKRFHQPPA